jgi:hypothetical protein
MPTAGGVLADEVVQERWHLDGGVRKGDVDGGVGELDLAGAHRDDPDQWLSEQEREQTADAGVAANGVVLQESFDVVPAFVVAHGDGRR